MFLFYGAYASLHVLWYLKAFILKDLVRAQWHSVDTKRTDDDIFIPQIILRSDYFSIKMIDLTWITPTQQRMSVQKNEPMLSQQGWNVICVSNVIIFMGLRCVWSRMCCLVMSCDSLTKPIPHGVPTSTWEMTIPIRPGLSSTTCQCKAASYGQDGFWV